MSKGYKANLVGRRFGHVVVTGISDQKKSDGSYMWICLCDCGNTAIFPTFELRDIYKFVKSCGRYCPLHKKGPKHNLTNFKTEFLSNFVLTGEKQGDGQYLWRADCACGGKVIASTAMFKNGRILGCGECTKKSDGKPKFGICDLCGEFFKPVHVGQRFCVPHGKAWRKAYSVQRGTAYRKRTDVWKPRAIINASLRNSRKRANGGKHTWAEWQLTQWIFSGKCFYCDEPTDRMTRDHVIPVSKGGTDWIENIVPACLPCNSKKYNHLDWAPALEVFREANC